MKDATSHGSACPQVSSFKGTTETFQNEDCLYLNIYSPFQVSLPFKFNSIQIETHIKAPLTLSTFVSHPSGSKLNSHHSEIQWRTVAFVENNVNITESIFRIIIRIHMAIHKKRTTTTTASCLDVHNDYKDMGWLFKTHLTCNIRYYFVT